MVFLNDILDEKYLAVIELAKQVGAYQKACFRNPNLLIESKSTAIDLVTEVDVYCDKRLVETLKELFPEDDILSEEQGLHDVGGAHTWVIDPLDGTTNFSIGLPIFAVSIARMKEGKPIFGVIYVPMLEDLFVAEKGKGAWLNEKPCSVSQSDELRKSVLATGFPYDRATAKNNNSKNIEQMIPKVKGIRRMGAAAYDIALVGAGILDGFWELRLALWDIAAAWLVVAESGGHMQVLEKSGAYTVICGNEKICEKIKAVVTLDDA